MDIALFYPVVYHQMFLYSLSESCHISVCSPILGQTQRPSIGTSAGNCAVAALCDVFCLPAHSGQQRHVRAPKPSGLKPYGWWWCLRIPCTFQGYAGNIYHIYPEKSWTLNKLNTRQCPDLPDPDIGGFWSHEGSPGHHGCSDTIVWSFMTWSPSLGNLHM